MSLHPPAVLEGAVLLTALCRDDAGLEQELSRDAEVVRHTYYPANLSAEGAQQRIADAEQRAEACTSRRYAIRDATTGEALGTCGITNLKGTPEVFYVVLPQRRGQGVATAAAKLLTDWLFAAGAEKVALETVKGNGASERVAERLGFDQVSSHQDEHLGEAIEVHRWERASGTQTSADAGDQRSEGPGTSA